MKKRYGIEREFHRAAWAILLLLAVAVVAFFITGCSPKIVEKVRTEYVTQLVHHRDTVSTKDSVYIREWMKGDTVYVDRFRDRYVFRDRWRDSIQVREVHDTTAVEVKVEKELSWTQRAKIGAFPWLLLAVVGCLLWIFRKWIFKI